MKIEMQRAAERTLDALPARERQRILDALARLAADRADPRLDVNPLGGQPGVLRLRVGRDWRVLFRIDAAADTATVALIRRRGDVYKR